ncbi:unnamed protein product [Prorocentrum cordatum]|uniref:Uncharacterized protein n=1 Tax=Prorocentrum cordatum TaxID=2364126 RepID=A0ABN9PRL8_9DINO|nr:unnamed protein product [Polarella glacialis]
MPPYLIVSHALCACVPLWLLVSQIMSPVESPFVGVAWANLEPRWLRRLRTARDRLQLRMYRPDFADLQLSQVDRQLRRTDLARFFARVPEAEVKEMSSALSSLRKVTKRHEDAEFEDGAAERDYADRQRQLLVLRRAAPLRRSAQGETGACCGASH